MSEAYLCLLPPFTSHLEQPEFLRERAVSRSPFMLRLTGGWEKSADGTTSIFPWRLLYTVPSSWRKFLDSQSVFAAVAKFPWWVLYWDYLYPPPLKSVGYSTGLTSKYVVISLIRNIYMSNRNLCWIFAIFSIFFPCEYLVCIFDASSVEIVSRWRQYTPNQTPPSQKLSFGQMGRWRSRELDIGRLVRLVAARLCSKK